jgi:dienelactone hydrolase
VNGCAPGRVYAAMTLVAWAILLGALSWGPHAVGFETGLVADVEASRMVDGKPRPIQMSLWYPAERKGRASLTFRDYVELKAGERGTASAGGTRAAVEQEAAFLRGAAKMDPGDVERWLDRPMRAVREAPPLAGRRALVLVAQGNGHGAADQAILCEFLASHGFVVATSPSPTRIVGPMQSDAGIAPMAQDQALDLAAIAKAARERPFVDAARTALVAHSFGARSGLLFLMHHDVAAFVSLDGGIGTKRGERELRASPLFDASRATTPIVHVYEELDGYMAPDFSLLRALDRADRFIVHAPHMHHIHFSSVNEDVDSFPALASATSADRQTARTYEEVAQLTLAFLDASLAGSAQAAFAKLGAGLTLKHRWAGSIRQK